MLTLLRRESKERENDSENNNNKKKGISIGVLQWRASCNRRKSFSHFIIKTQLKEEFNSAANKHNRNPVKERAKKMSWRRVLKSVQALAAHCLLFSFTLLLVFKLDHVVSCSWWSVHFFF